MNPTRTFQRGVILVSFLAAFATAAFGQSLNETLASAPVNGPQSDGVFCLSAAAAEIVKWNGTQPVLASEDRGVLKVENGSVTSWDGEKERPTWRVEIPAPGFYRVVIRRMTPLGQEGSAAFYFIGQKTRSLACALAATGDARAVQPFEIGEIELDAGRQFVEFRPLSWVTPFEIGRLAEVRLIPMNALRKLSRPANDAMRRMGIDKLPEVAALADRLTSLQKEDEALNKETRRKDFSGFSDFNQFFAFDRLAPRLAEVGVEVKRVNRQWSDLMVAKASAAPDATGKLKPEEQMVLHDYLQANAAAVEAAIKVYSPAMAPNLPATAPKGKTPFSASNAPSAPQAQDSSRRRTLFPTGNFDTLPAQPIDEKLPITTLNLQPPPDAAQRMARFKQRDSDAGLAALCREFRATLVPGTKGLEEFERLCAAGKPKEALEAYRAYFFDKLANPEKYGAVTENILFELARDRGRRELLLRPSAFVVAKNLANTAVAQIGKEVVVGQVGAPGAVSWVPYGLNIPPSAAVEGRVGQDPFWQTPAGKDARRTLEFFRYLGMLPGDRDEYYKGGLFPALLWSYTITGDKAHLARWCEYVDDWTINAARDQDNHPYSLRNAVELETQFVRCTLNLLRIVLDERPELARDFDAPTLARFMMKLVTDYTPYTIRARRAEMANWGIMGIAHELHLSSFLNEFKAMGYFGREGWRLWNANMIQHRTLDGENIEAWDDGHNWVTLGFVDDSVPFARLPAEVDALDRTAFWDDVKTDARSKLVHISPGGNYWPYWTAKPRTNENTIRNRPTSYMRYGFERIAGEPGAMSRIQTILGSGHPDNASLPDRFSDVSPYAAMYYLRESWQPDADYLILQNFRDRSQEQADCSRTMYTLSKGDRILVEAHGLVVDRKPDNRYADKLMTGGKTDYCGEAGRHVSGDRFHTSATFDFAEAKQDAPYAIHRKQYNDAYGLYRQPMPNGDPHPITDVSVLRQTFGVRGEGLWIACDRIENKSGSEHEYTQFFTLPVRIETNGFADRVRLIAASGSPLVETNEKESRIRTNSPGFENASLFCFAPSPLKFANVLDEKREHQTLRKSSLETIQEALKEGKTPEAILKQPIREPVSVRWSGAGNGVFITAMITRPAVFDTAKPFSNDARVVQELKGGEGVMGCHVLTRSATEVWFQSGPKSANRLVCGPVAADAESLLVVKKSGGVTSGIVLGCAALSVGGKPVVIPGADFEFALDSRSHALTSVEAIRRPIDTVRILPEQGVFTDRIDVAFDIPTQKADDIEFHYTLDGSDPTLESPLYKAPFPIQQTTLVKVRPFRKALKGTPWTFSGTESGKTIAAIFRQRAPLPAVRTGKTEPGLNYAYFEGNWPTLFSYAGFPGVLEPKKTGAEAALLNAGEIARIRSTGRAFAVRYDGFLNVPAAGLYTFYAPPHLYAPTMDAGYDLRVFVDGEEWFPAPRLHAENTWSVPLQAGLHQFQVSYADYRWKTFRNDYWMAWRAEEMWAGVPVLEVSGPGIVKQAVPDAWLNRMELSNK